MLEPGGASTPEAFNALQVHWFEFKTEQGEVVGVHVAVTPYVSTPEAALQLYAREFPGHPSASAARRYAALSRQIAFAPELVARQAPGPDPANSWSCSTTTPNRAPGGSTR